MLTLAEIREKERQDQIAGLLKRLHEAMATIEQLTTELEQLGYNIPQQHLNEPPRTAFDLLTGCIKPGGADDRISSWQFFGLDGMELAPKLGGFYYLDAAGNTKIATCWSELPKHVNGKEISWIPKRPKGGRDGRLRTNSKLIIAKLKGAQ